MTTMITSFRRRRLIPVTRTRDERGYECNRRIESPSSILENFNEEYDGATGNLLSRTHDDGPKESFAYDNLDRLISVKRGEAEPVEIYYEDNGNIAYKTGVGSYVYNRSSRPHAVMEVENADGSIPSDALEFFSIKFKRY